MDTIIVAIIVVLAIGYLYRHFYSASKNKDPSGGCGACGAQCGKGLSCCQNVSAIQKKMSVDKGKQS
jgi:hypothetical protein